jgi:hypothetical protein
LPTGWTVIEFADITVTVPITWSFPLCAKLAIANSKVQDKSIARSLIVFLLFGVAAIFSLA